MIFKHPFWRTQIKSLGQYHIEPNSDSIWAFQLVYLYSYFPVHTLPEKLKRVTLIFIFKASTLWADAFYKSKCPSVCLSVRLSVCSLLRYRLNVFLLPLFKIRCPIFLEIQNPWGKVMERVVSDLNILFESGLKSQFFLVFWRILPYKTRWKTLFSMD